MEQQGEHMEEKGHGLGIEEQRVWCGADQVGSWEVSRGQSWKVLDPGAMGAIGGMWVVAM